METLSGKKVLFQSLLLELEEYFIPFNDRQLYFTFGWVTDACRSPFCSWAAQTATDVGFIIFVFFS